MFGSLIQQKMRSRQNGLKEKQIKHKLDRIDNIQELKQIYTNIQQQNNILREDNLHLKSKIDLLMQKQKNKVGNVGTEDPAKMKQIKMHQNELKQQYKIMQQLKKRKEACQSESATEELAVQLTSLQNRLKTVQGTLGPLRMTIKDLKKQGGTLEQSLAVLEQEQQRNQPKISQYSSQNTNLRKKIFSLRKLQSQKESESSKIMNSMYTFKIKMNKNQQFERSLSTQRLTKVNQTISKSKSEQVDAEALKKEVNALKEEMHRRQQQYNKLSLQNSRRKQQLMVANKEATVEQKELDDKKARLQRELNKYKRIWEKYIELKNNSKFTKEYAESVVQADEYTDKDEPLRRQFAGIIGGKIRFDDRQVLKHNKRSKMIGFMVYEIEHNATSRNNLVAFRAIYDDLEANQNNRIPLPGYYLSKCKLTKYMMMEGDFIKLFKIKYQANDSHILKIQIRTNKNNRYEFGDRRNFNDLSPGQNVYGFDIAITQYPVCLFGSYNTSKSHWFLQSLGVQINELEE